MKNSNDICSDIFNSGENILKSIFGGIFQLFITYIFACIIGFLFYIIITLFAGIIKQFVFIVTLDTIWKILIIVFSVFIWLIFVSWIIDRLYKKSKFEEFAKWLDGHFRRLDWEINRSWWNVPDRYKYFFQKGHSWVPTLFTLCMIYFIATGPCRGDFDRSILIYSLIFAFSICVFISNFILNKFYNNIVYPFASHLFIFLIFCYLLVFKYNDLTNIIFAFFLCVILFNLIFNEFLNRTYLAFISHLFIVLIFSLLLFFMIGDYNNRVDDSDFYVHILLVAFWIVCAGIIFSRIICIILFYKFKNKVRIDSIKELDIPEKQENLEVDSIRFLRSLIRAPCFHIVEILYWPSLPIIFFADIAVAKSWAFIYILIAWVIYSFGEMHDDLENFLEMIKRILFSGGQLFISIIIILLAAGRLFEYSYIQTLLEYKGLNFELFNYIISFYILFMYFGYWTNRFLSESLLAIYKDKYDGCPVIRFYCHDDNMNNPVSRDGILIPHGSMRFALIGGNSGRNHCTIKHIIGQLDLIKQVINDYCRINTASNKYNKSSNLITGHEFKILIKHRLKFYYLITYIFIIALSLIFSYKAHRLPQKAELEAKLVEKETNTSFKLEDHLFKDKNPKILLAASGGGTRAALYTYSFLRGLHERNLLDKVILASGVSGGSAAIAYFAMHRNSLLKENLLNCKNGKAHCHNWNRFRETMSDAYIQDVLIGISELRLFWGCKEENKVREGLRLGELLKESFDRHFSKNVEYRVFKKGCDRSSNHIGNDGTNIYIGDLNDLGLIFNAAIAGRFDKNNIKCREGDFDCERKINNLSEIERYANHEDYDGKTTQSKKGGRLILTNLFIEKCHNKKCIDNCDEKCINECYKVDFKGKCGNQNYQKLCCQEKCGIEKHLNDQYKEGYDVECKEFCDKIDLQGDCRNKKCKKLCCQEKCENEKCQGPFPDHFKRLKATPEDYLPYIAIDDPKVPLVSAAALSANFPPVFPNAAIDIADFYTCGLKDSADSGKDEYRWRYWVTDGGATDNRGIISLLYALEGGIKKVLNKTNKDKHGLNFPPIHIVVVDASATEYYYNQDRGIKTTLGAAERFASQLMIQKIIEIAKLYSLTSSGKDAKIYFHKLFMPLSFRCSGGIGTHWMLPKTVTLRKPKRHKSGNDIDLNIACKKADLRFNFVNKLFNIIPDFLSLSEPGVKVSGEKAIKLLEMLHGVFLTKENNQCTKRLFKNFVCEDNNMLSHKKSWCCFIKTLDKEKLDQTYIAPICERETCESFNCSDVLVELPEKSGHRVKARDVDSHI